MIINSIDKYYSEDLCYISSEIECEITNSTKKIFYSVSSKFGEYLVNEIADAFVLACILPALVSKQNIIVKGAVSEDLRYNFNTLIFLLSKVFNYPSIYLIEESIYNVKFNSSACATGFSRGVDSLTTFLKHSNKDECPKGYMISHLTLFNVGSYGNDYNYSKERFIQDSNCALEFSKVVDMPLVLLDSNIGELYSEKEIFHFSLRSTICLSSGILALQKLFKKYFISSSGTIDDMKLNRWDQYYYENSLVQLLSNKNVDIHISEADMNRVQKTDYTANSDLASRYLYVCASDIYNGEYGTNFSKDTSPNCSECVKCTRTILTLDFLGVLDKYSNRFDLSKYEKMKSDLIIDVWLNYKSNHFKNEIFQLMKQKGYSLDLKMKLKYYRLLVRRKIKTAFKILLLKVKI